MRKAIFTVVIGEYDKILPAPKFEGWDCFLFTDKSPDDSKGWIVKLVPSEVDQHKASRRYKILSHKFLPDYDLVCYIDGNMKLRKEPPSHPMRGLHYSVRGVYHEASEVIRQKRANPDVINRQVNFYRLNGIKGATPIYQNGFFVRTHDKETNDIHDLWWNHVDMFSHRDQISLPAILEMRRITLAGTVQNHVIQQYFSIESDHSYEKQFVKKPAVHHITPARADKNIGKAINDLVKNIDDDDWVCLRDIDTIPPLHKEFIVQCEEIASSGKFDLVGCITNRSGLERQLYNKKISSDMDIMNHIEIAEELIGKHGSSVSSYTGTIAGIMMLFSKRIWMAIGGLDEGGIVNKANEFFDYTFCQKVMRVRGRIGVADGVYVFHLYRPKSDNPTRDTLHLY